MAKSWKQKLDGGKPPHVEVLDKKFGGASPGAKMLVSQPREVDSYMRELTPGMAQGVAEMRTILARRHGADVACPISTSIFARIAAEAALDELALGADLDTITPFWRTIDPTSDLAGKLSCGGGFIEQQRAREKAG